MSASVPIEVITDKILEIRGEKVMLDVDLAKLYGVPTKRLNEAVKRNKTRFPEDLMFRLTRKERKEVVAICDHFTNLKYSPTLPHAFTEAGVAMLASVLNSETAIQINLQIVRAFVRLRRMLVQHDALRLAIEGLERRVGKNERDIQIAIGALQNLLRPAHDGANKGARQIGFVPRKKEPPSSDGKPASKKAVRSRSRTKKTRAR